MLWINFLVHFGFWFAYSEASEMKSTGGRTGVGADKAAREKLMTNCCFKTKHYGRTCELQKNKTAIVWDVLRGRRECKWFSGSRECTAITADICLNFPSLASPLRRRSLMINASANLRCFKWNLFNVRKIFLRCCSRRALALVAEAQHKSCLPKITFFKFPFKLEYIWNRAANDIGYQKVQALQLIPHN